MDKTTNLLAVTVPIACQQLSVGKTQLYSLINDGSISAFKIGNARRISVESMRAYVQKQIALEQKAGQS